MDLEKPPTCRCLFGPIDRTLLRRDLNAINKALDDQVENQWNFNFRDETPLKPSGQDRYSWERVDGSDAESEEKEVVPAAYDMPHLSWKVSTCTTKDNTDDAETEAESEEAAAKLSSKRKRASEDDSIVNYHQSEITGKPTEVLNCLTWREASSARE